MSLLCSSIDRACMTPPALTSPGLCWETKSAQASVFRRNKDTGWQDREEEGHRSYMKRLVRLRSVRKAPGHVERRLLFHPKPPRVGIPLTRSDMKVAESRLHAHAPPHPIIPFDAACTVMGRAVPPWHNEDVPEKCRLSRDLWFLGKHLYGTCERTWPSTSPALPVNDPHLLYQHLFTDRHFCLPSSNHLQLSNIHPSQESGKRGRR
ncbi:unnamed protein product [Pleuronectes platessa]|uniref:Uncharacterized protein n=1 Tax=Pleuronectes platessa TaxID=8262 RepID=A0A9N7V0Y5_PLEPL|nr:unnamed protein product [Pleuronectes platessa]